MNINYIEPVVPVAGADQTGWIMALILAGYSCETSLPFLWSGRSLLWKSSIQVV